MYCAQHCMNNQSLNIKCDSLKVAIGSAVSFRDELKDLQRQVRELQVGYEKDNSQFSIGENSTSLTNLIVDCRQLEGDHGHRCWPSGAAVLYLGTVFLNPIDFIHESIPIHPIM